MKNDNVNSLFEMGEGFIAPWGLANEDRPFHFLWSGDVERLDLIFPKPVDLAEGHNIDGSISEYSSLTEGEDGHELVQVTIPGENLVTPGYFSGKFNIPYIFDKPIVAQKICAEFHLDDGRTEKWNDFTFTIRPNIRVDEAPDVHEIPENGEPDPIEIDMQYIGFGLAQIRTKAGWEGELISKGDSIYHDMAEALVDSGLYQKEAEEIPDIPDNWKDGAEVNIPQEEIELFVREFREQIEGGNMEELFEPEVLDQLVGFLKADDEDRDMSPVYQQIELMLLGSVLDLIDRHPSENVEMANPQTKVEIENQMKGIRVKYELSDTMGNDYESVDIPIDITDKRPDSEELIEIDIDTNWEEIQWDTEELHHLKEDIAEL